MRAPVVTNYVRQLPTICIAIAYICMLHKMHTLLYDENSVD